MAHTTTVLPVTVTYTSASVSQTALCATCFSMLLSRVLGGGAANVRHSLMLEL
jgi:hypothetical protein